MPQLRIVLIYILVGLLWIYYSDWAIQQLFSSSEALTRAQNFKGWFFIIVTGGMLYILIRAHVSSLTQANQEMVNSYDQTIRGWIRVMDLRHRETKDHTERVSVMAVELARLCGISDPKQLEQLERGAILHDIGKIGVPDSILTKPGPLTDAEFEQVKQHPVIAKRILSDIQFLQPCLDIPHHHHERWDGSRYPEGLAGEEAPLVAREPEVLSYLKSEAGRQFDPQIVKIFLKHYEAMKNWTRISADERSITRSRQCAA